MVKVAIGSKLNTGRGLVLVLGLLLMVAVVTIAVLATKLSAADGESRTVTVTGEATLQEIPDQYVFYPSYSFQKDDKASALDETAKKSDEVVAGLKKLGVADSAIKTNSDSYDMPVYYDRIKSQATFNLRLTVTLKDKDIAQKVQDYLLTTGPSGGITPIAGFSEAKRKSIESKARDQATKDARNKADQSARNLGFKVGRVESVSDGNGFDALPLKGDSGRTSAAVDAIEPAMAPELSLQPGLNDVNYSVTVVYEIK
jgi:uncharacterized protein